MYLENLRITVRAELAAIPRPLSQEDAKIVASFELFNSVADRIHEHMAFRLLQAIRLVIPELGTAEAPAADDPPSAVPG